MSHAIALSGALAGTGPNVDFSGAWKNELTSTMTLMQANGQLTGVYASAVADTNPPIATQGDIQGYVDGNLISFVVHWRDFQAITAWVGRLTSTGEIETLWQMIKQVKPGFEWESINANSDTFSRVP